MLGNKADKKYCRKKIYNKYSGSTNNGKKGREKG
jgi:hypothetical protein